MDRRISGVELPIIGLKAEAVIQHRAVVACKQVSTYSQEAPRWTDSIATLNRSRFVYAKSACLGFIAK